ncbi:hypothetical protein IFM89_019488 [Coptis chinensis]|uniref:Endonuclease/exonuclease/phosphatase domain-containing protein n=1 Tax=Coptis chinensis TaxID=261450 RepID=A0A835GZU2_9MAGN|nr:hypothetical protein IFM89_019488 [Coptis chinensis]
MSYADKARDRMTQTVELECLPIPSKRGNTIAIKLSAKSVEKGLEACKYALVARLDMLKLNLESARAEANTKWGMTEAVKISPLVDIEQGFEDAVDTAQEFVMRTNTEQDMGNMKDKEQESMSRALVVHDSQEDGIMVHKAIDTAWRNLVEEVAGVVINEEVAPVDNVGLVLALGVADVVVDHIDILESQPVTTGPIVVHNGFFESCFGYEKLIGRRGVNVSLIYASAQHVTVLVEDCVVTAVHAACLMVQRRQLWAELENLMPNLPWVVLGDLNVVLHNDEKKGGLPSRRSSMLEFLNWYNNCDLQLSDHVGLKYTWCNNQHGSGRILARLDRVFYNQAWIQKFGGWRYKVGSREWSDHSPLLGAMAHIPRPHNVPFRFNQAWTSHKEFKDFMKCSWPSFVEGSPIFRMNTKL